MATTLHSTLISRIFFTLPRNRKKEKIHLFKREEEEVGPFSHRTHFFLGNCHCNVDRRNNNNSVRMNLTTSGSSGFSLYLAGIVVFLSATTVYKVDSSNGGRGSVGGRILVGYAPDMKSHLKSMLPFINRLALAGHQITVLYVRTNSTGEPERFSHPNISALMVELPSGMTRANHAKLGAVIWRHTAHAYSVVGSFLMFCRVIDTIIAHGAPQLSDVLNDGGGWDFVLVSDLFALHANGVSWMLHRGGEKVPYGVFSSSGTLSYDSYHLALGQNWVAKSQMYTTAPWDASDLYAPRRFSNRLINVFEHTSELVGMKLLDFSILPRLVGHLTGWSPDDFSRSAFIRESSLHFNEAISHLGGGQSVANAANVLGVGSHCDEAKPLTVEHLRLFVEHPDSKGTIYIAFGTLVPWDYAPEKIKEALFDALELLPDYRILFAYNGEIPSRQFSSHIKLVKWAPQLDVLAHASTRVFLTHGGLKSVKEALCTRTPMLVMPMFAEQNHNARMVLALGIGSALNKFRLSAAGVAAALREVLERPAYAERVAKLQRVFLDGGPLPALDLGAHRVSRLVDARRRWQGNQNKNPEMANTTTLQATKSAAGVVKLSRHFEERKGMHLGIFEYFHLDLITMFVLGCLLAARK